MIFLELVVLKCSNLKFIKVTTTVDPRQTSDQGKALHSLKKDLERRSIQLDIVFADNLHDRQIM